MSEFWQGFLLGAVLAPIFIWSPLYFAARGAWRSMFTTDNDRY